MEREENGGSLGNLSEQFVLFYISKKQRSQFFFCKIRFFLFFLFLFCLLLWFTSSAISLRLYINMMNTLCL